MTECEENVCENGGTCQMLAGSVICTCPPHLTGVVCELREYNILCIMSVIRESVDSLCRDGADMPRPPYIGKACTRPNLEDLSLFRYLTIVYESLCTQ